MLPDLHTDFSRGWSGGLVFPSLSEFSTVYCDPHSHDPAIPLLGIYPEKTKIEKDTRTLKFIAALFTIARTWKQLRCPSTDKWIKKLWYIYTVEYYSAIKRNAFESVFMRWMNLQPITWSEVS